MFAAVRATRVASPEPDLADHQLSFRDAHGSWGPSVEPPALIASITALPDSPQQQNEAGVDCEIGAAIAIVMARFPVTYTKAFAMMIAYSERTQQRLPDLAAAVLKTYSPQPSDTASTR